MSASSENNRSMSFPIFWKNNSASPYIVSGTIELEYRFIYASFNQLFRGTICFSLMCHTFLFLCHAGTFQSLSLNHQHSTIHTDVPTEFQEYFERQHSRRHHCIFYSGVIMFPRSICSINSTTLLSKKRKEKDIFSVLCRINRALRNDT